jgi:hypothetical protein
MTEVGDQRIASGQRLVGADLEVPVGADSASFPLTLGETWGKALEAW